MISKLSKEITLIVYDTPAPPKCLKINKTVFKLVLVTIPVILLTCLIITSYILTNLKSLENNTLSKQPKLISDLRQQIALLEQNLNTKEVTNNELQRKIADGARTNGIPANVFQTPLGFTDRTDSNAAKVEDIKFEHANSSSTISFNLVNNLSEDEKLSGYIFVQQLGSSNVKFYPELPLGTGEFYFKYNMGESFTASRFRPVVAKFTNLGLEEIQYKVYIFSRSGDLLLEQLLGPFNTSE